MSLLDISSNFIEGLLGEKKPDKMAKVDSIISILLTNSDAYNARDKKDGYDVSLIDEDKLMSKLSDKHKKILSKKSQREGIELYKSIMEMLGPEVYLNFLGDSLYEFSDGELDNIYNKLSKYDFDKQREKFEDYLFIDVNTTDSKLREILRKINEYKDLTPDDILYVEKNQKLFSSANSFGSTKLFGSNVVRIKRRRSVDKVKHKTSTKKNRKRTSIKKT
jgi:hypothetical protein